jgi:hypothetical protein
MVGSVTWPASSSTSTERGAISAALFFISSIEIPPLILRIGRHSRRPSPTNPPPPRMPCRTARRCKPVLASQAELHGGMAATRMIPTSKKRVAGSFMGKSPLPLGKNGGGETNGRKKAGAVERGKTVRGYREQGCVVFPWNLEAIKAGHYLTCQASSRV